MVSRKEILLVIFGSQLLVLLVMVVLFYTRIKMDNNEGQVTNLSVELEPAMLASYIDHHNAEPRIYNAELYGDTVDLVIVVQVHKRPHYLQQLINSLRLTPSINTTLLIFSHDYFHATLNNIIQNIDFAKVMQIFYPYSIQTHPKKFPGPDPNDCQKKSVPNCTNDFKDTFGNYRDPFLSQIKHHWWWKVNFVFDGVKILQNYSDLVLFVEEDHYAAPDFMHCLSLMKKYSKFKCSTCWFYSLGIPKGTNFDVFYNKVVIVENNFRNLGVAFNRTIWNKISKSRKHFCEFDDYNWDWSLSHLMNAVPEKVSSMAVAASRIVHIGECGTHVRKRNCDANAIINKYKNAQANLFPEDLNFLTANASEVSNFGGWGDPRDQELCMKM